MKESIRLLQCIHTRESYDLKRWQSPRIVALNIFTLARPLMEKIRLMIYNIILCVNGRIDHQITLRITPINKSICSRCAQKNLQSVGPFYIYQYVLDENIEDINCQCPVDDHRFMIQSNVEYLYTSVAMQPKSEELEVKLNDYLSKCDQLCRFLREDQERDWSDPFHIILTQFIEEEDEILQQNRNNSHLNTDVLGKLKTIMERRSETDAQLLGVQERLPLKQVIKLITELTTIQDVNNHMKSVKKTGEIQMKASERKIPMDYIQNHDFLKTFQ